MVLMAFAKVIAFGFHVAHAGSFGRLYDISSSERKTIDLTHSIQWLRLGVSELRVRVLAGSKS